MAGTDYHTLVDPVLFQPVTLNVASNEGLALPPSLFGSCGPLGIVNINTLDSFLTGTVLPQLASQGVGTSQFPVFLLYNLVMSIGVPTDLNKCCVLGFHGATGTPIQTYSPIDLTPQVFSVPLFVTLRSRLTRLGNGWTTRLATIPRPHGDMLGKSADARTIWRWAIL